jgi:threonylcarbamoyladenosine tRNA methylthiotransferase MtaB
MNPGKKVAFYTLGCKVNQSESQAMARQFMKLGYEVVDFEAPAAVYIINTCTVTQAADQKSRKMIRQAKKRCPQSLLVVTGCYAQSGEQALMAMGDVDLILDNAAKKDLPQRVELALSAQKQNDPQSNSQNNIQSNTQNDAADLQAIDTQKENDLKSEKQGLFYPEIKGLHRSRATLKIQDGCRQFCSYCIIPHVRGSWQSLSEAEVLRQAKELAAEGYKEIVLLGIHLGAYGWERGEKEGLSQILEKLLLHFPQVRFRLGSLEPMEATGAIVRLISTYPNACKHLHLPLQCGQDEILKQMNRPYSTKDFAMKVAEIRSLCPEIALTTDVMVGFPGEDEAMFEQSLKFVEQIGFARLHVFAYSPRPGTPAADMKNQVDKAEKEARSHRMIALGERLAAQYASGWFGQKQQVLVEESLADQVWSGHTDNYLEVTFQADSVAELRGTLQTVMLTGEAGQKPASWAARLLSVNT